MPIKKKNIPKGIIIILKYFRGIRKFAIIDKIIMKKIPYIKSIFVMLFFCESKKFLKRYENPIIMHVMNKFEANDKIIFVFSKIFPLKFLNFSHLSRVPNN